VSAARADQWNIDVEDGDLVIWNRRQCQVVSDGATPADYDREIAATGSVITAVLHRRSA
jgi:hypothetical protein